jgi:hypothetical protein
MSNSIKSFIKKSFATFFVFVSFFLWIFISSHMANILHGYAKFGDSYDKFPNKFIILFLVISLMVFLTYWILSIDVAKYAKQIIVLLIFLVILSKAIVEYDYLLASMGKGAILIWIFEFVFILIYSTFVVSKRGIAKNATYPQKIILILNTISFLKIFSLLFFP